MAEVHASKICFLSETLLPARVKTTIKKMTDASIQEFLAKASKARHKYCGTLDENGFRMGNGCQQWFKGEAVQKYSGQFLYNNFQNNGIYLADKKGDQTYFDGLFYANKLEGYGKVIYSDTTSFEGLFKQHVRFGPGVLTYTNDTQDVGLWDGFALRRILVSVGEKFLPRLAQTSVGKARLLKYRSLVPICTAERDPAKEILIELGASEDIVLRSNQLYNVHVRNPESLFFDKSLYNASFTKQDCTIDVLISQEEFEDSSTQSGENECGGSFERNDSSCLCFQSNWDRFGHLSAQLQEVESRLEKLQLKKQRFEEKLRKCRYCCDQMELLRKLRVAEKAKAKEEDVTKNISNQKTDSPKILSVCSESEETEFLNDLTRSERELKSYFYTTSHILKDIDLAENCKTLSLGCEDRLFKETQYGNLNDTTRTRVMKVINYDTFTESSEEANEMFDHQPTLQTCYCNQLLIENIDVLNKKLESLKQEELFYSTIKTNIKNHLDAEFRKIEGLTAEESRFIKKVSITDLLAWNNEEIWVMMLQHSFRHRLSENNVSFNVKDLLIGHRHYFKAPGDYETKCRKFLEECSEGHERNICGFIRESNINPDLCDMRGNTGLILAAFGDKVSAISMLVNCGAKLDAMNDEGLTPLTAAFLKYLTFKFKINDWEKAFLPEAKPVNVDTNQWRPTDSLLSLYDNFPTDNIDEIKGQASTETSESLQGKHTVTDFFPLTSSLNGSKKKQEYIFKTGFVRPLHPKHEEDVAKERKKKKKRKNKTPEVTASKLETQTPKEDLEEIDANCNRKLDTIKKTIMTILQHGSNPNVGEVPLKPIFLAIFTDDSDFMYSLLQNKADPDELAFEENLTSLHVIASRKLSSEKVKMCEILLNFKADPNLKTDITHWKQLKDEIVGEGFDTTGILNAGKNPLHLLCLREDFVDDEDNFCGSMAKQLVINGCRTDDSYLGHTPLSLAVLRGNKKLIESLLDTRQVDPYYLLGNGMGNAFTVLVLNRFAFALSNEMRVEVAQTLLHNGVNPLNRVDQYENAIAFMENEVNLAHLKRKSSRKIGRDKSKSKRASSKLSKKSASKLSKKSSTKLSKKSSTNNGIESLKEFIIEETRKILFRHIQGQAIQYLYSFISETMVADPVVVVLAKFATPDEALDIIRLLFQHGLINHNKLNLQCVFDLLQFVSLQNNHEEISIDCKKIESKIKNTYWKELNDPPGVYLPLAEVDKDVDKYRVCFQCFKSEDKKLLTCPSCGLIYFCSEECNILNNNTCSYHPCKLPFYDTVRDIIKEENQPSRLHALLEMTDKIRNEKLLRSQLEKISKIKYPSPGIKKKVAELTKDLKKLEKEKSDFAASLWDYKLILMADDQTSPKITVESLKTEPRSPGETLFAIKSPRQVVSDIYQAYSSVLHTASTAILPSASDPQTFQKSKKSSSTKSNIRRSVSSPVRGFHPDTSLSTGVLFAPKSRRKSSSGLRSSQVMDFIAKKLQPEDKLPLVVEGRENEDKTKKVADKSYYMELLSKIFADFNLPLLLLPYACYKDGQVYYSMSGNSPYFGSGFHKLKIPD